MNVEDNKPPFGNWGVGSSQEDRNPPFRNWGEGFLQEDNNLPFGNWPYYIPLPIWGQWWLLVGPLQTSLSGSRWGIFVPEEIPPLQFPNRGKLSPRRNPLHGSRTGGFCPY